MSTELRPNTITLIWGFAMLPPEVLKDLHKDYSYTQVERVTGISKSTLIRAKKNIEKKTIA